MRARYSLWPPITTTRSARLWQACALSHTLTIGESDRFLEYGGAVNLFFVDGHIGFEVSLAALDRAGVSISSTLLRYGQVKARPRP